MDHEQRFDVLAHVVEITNASVDVNERLDSILNTINSHLGSRLAMLFLQETAKSQLTQANAWPRQPKGETPLEVAFGQGALGRVARDRDSQLITVGADNGDPAVDALCQSGELAALFPVMDDNRLYGVLLLVFASGPTMDTDEVRLLQMVSREMAGTIRNHRLYFEAKRRITELNVISDLGRAAVSTIELDELLDSTASMVAKLLGARGGMLCINAPTNDPPRLQAAFGAVPPECLDPARECLGSCKFYADPPDEAESGSLEGAKGICVALSFKGNYSGHLCVFEKMVLDKDAVPRFNVEDRNLLGTMASMISSALENALIFQRMEVLVQRNEEMVGALATLYEISTVLMTTMDFEATVLIIMDAVIHPAGMDHDRVVLFLVDEDEKVLRPIASLTKDVENGLHKELTQSLQDIRDSRPHRALLADERLAELAVPLDPPDSVVAMCVDQGVTMVVEDPRNDPRMNPEMAQALGLERAFVAVPMFAKGKVVGELLVNNLISGRPFNERDLKLLGMLANQGGLALETARLYHHLERVNKELAQMRNRLLEADKLAALGEIAAGVAHEIRNPLVSIGGFTRRIRKKVGDDSPLTQYLDVIIDEVTRLEKTLNEMLDFSSDARGHFEEHDLNEIIDQSLDLISRELTDQRIEVNQELGSGLPPVYCDDRQIKHVFLNLFLNAIQAMGLNDGHLTVRTFSVVREGKQFVAGEVTDTGGGIPMDIVHNIFNPFFTTKDQGSGLGLSIVHKIVTRHFGQVEVHNRGEGGASFLVTLPAAEEGRAYLK
ncbi:MAG: GAF domain-containing protein [Desulfarculaceae bacterium]|nr:GAF domain-containing protein [Desulfarculaceae bacterium]MCF8071792.1 GAF domain-containing protein [Desulfarculaceae bacterium]MCF8101342.1 GAF domain-containing protein [Desulfarculaceae bacterium]MCF8117197.1 GAF domain-containing protein [Desulfarculaceae bacterium]